MKGYKVFNPDWTCRGFQYKIGETFTQQDKMEICESGFHFCRKINDCFNYYPFDSDNKVAEIEALGAISTHDDESVTDVIKIVREISWSEVLELSNHGKNCTGNGNTGDYNSGNYNSGNNNSGNFNSCDHSNGRTEFLCSEGMQILRQNFHNMKWVHVDHMTDEEKISHPEYETARGYHKTLDCPTAYQYMWELLTPEEKQKVVEIPNFDDNVFKEITGIDINCEKF